MELTSIEFSVSFYTISASIGNNYLTIRKVLHSDGTTLKTMVVIVPDGNYLGADLLSYINSYAQNYADPLDGNKYFTNTHFYLDAKTNTNTGSGRIIISSFSLTGATNPITLPIPRASYTAGPITPDIEDSGYKIIIDLETDIKGNPDTSHNIQRSLGWILGFRKQQYTSDSLYISDGVYDFAGFKYIYLSVNDFNNNVNNGFIGAFQNSLLNENVLARLSVLAPIFSLDSQSNVSSIVSQPREYFGPVVIQRLQIQLLDEFGVPLDTNNMDYSFTLGFNVIYDI